MRPTVHADDDALGIDRIHNSRTAAEDDGTRVAGRNIFHAGSNVGGVAAEQRNRLALHVRSHERAVGVIVLKERDQAGCDRNKLLRADVHVLDVVAALEDEVTRLAGIGQIGNDPGVFVEGHVGLGGYVLVLLPSREVVAVGVELGQLAAGAG